MQSGISASPDLHRTFASFVSTHHLFALPITISAERLIPLNPIPYPSSDHDFSSALSSLSQHVRPRTPTYLILRKSNTANDFAAVTYIPSDSPVRSKTLFASTRATLVRELGTEKFTDTLFATDAEEILNPAQWAERSASNAHTGATDTGVLSHEERELQDVKRAEDEGRHGTRGRDLMGTGGSGYSSGTSTTGGSGSSSGLRMKMTDDARKALNTLSRNDSGPERGKMVQLAIDVPSEMLTLLSSAPCMAPENVKSSIPIDKPSYTFYHYPATNVVVFIYTCPATSKVKERMIYASSRAAMLELAKGEGVDIVKRIEVDEPGEVGLERLREELEGVKPDVGATRQAFARPQKPGRRHY